jgi:hypothetical protein
MTTGLWANACFSSLEDAPVRQGLHDIEISCAFAVWSDQENKNCRCMWEYDRGATFRYGVGKFEPFETSNQCVFVRGYAILESEPIGRNCELPDGFILSDGDEDESLWI